MNRLYNNIRQIERERDKYIYLNISIDGMESVAIKHKCEVCKRYTNDTDFVSNIGYVCTTCRVQHNLKTYAESKSLYSKECLRCRHKWISRIPNPVCCPKCKTPLWNRPRRIADFMESK